MFFLEEFFLTVIIMLCEIRFVDKEIVISIKLPEFAVDHIEMLIAEVGSHLIDILLVFEDRYHRQKVASSQFGDGNSSAPASIYTIEYPGDHLASRIVKIIKQDININLSP